MKTKSMNVTNNELYIGKYKASDLALKYKTPLYVYDEINLRYKLNLYKNYFQSEKYNCRVVYASKAFICPYLMNLIDEYGFYMDSVSEGDLYQINNYSFPMNHIVLHGNNKDESEIDYAIKNNVGYIVIDNYDELDLIIKVNQKYQKQLQLLLRVNPGISAHTHEYIQTSTLSSKFGESIFDEQKIDSIIRKCKDNPLLNLTGFHCHIGSNICNPKYFEQAINTMLEFISETSKRNQTKFDVLNLGGGFGIKYLDTDQEIDIELMLKTIISTVDKYIENNPNFILKELMIEPGRSIVGDSGSTLYTVGGIKKTYGGKKYVFVDGGMTDNIRPALYQAQYMVDICNNVNSDDNEKDIYDVVGPCCESGDIIVCDYPIGKVNKGDTLITYCTGAYGYSMSSNYNSRVRGAVIFVSDDKINIGIKREEYSDLIIKYPHISKTQIFDTHSDMLYDLYTSKCKGINNRFKNYHLPQLNNSVIGGSIFTMYSPNDFDLIEACSIALKEIDLTGMKDFKILLGLEGLRNLKKVEDIDILYNMGFRHAMLTWNEENKYATGAKADPNKGLKEDGVKLLQRMQEKGMIIDLAHLNEKSFYEVLEVVDKNIIYSHGNCKALCNHVRNVTDDQMRALKKKDGLLGLTLANNFVSEKEQDQTLSNFLNHIKHAISIMGVDNICFGFDFMDYLDDFPNSNLNEVNNASLSYRIIEGLKSIGLSQEDINKICYNNFYNRYKHLLYIK